MCWCSCHLLLMLFHSIFSQDRNEERRCQRLTSNEIYCMYNFSRIIRSRSLCCCLLLLLLFRLYIRIFLCVTKKGEGNIERRRRRNATTSNKNSKYTLRASACGNLITQKRRVYSRWLSRQAKILCEKLSFSSSNPIWSEVEREIIHQLDFIFSSQRKRERATKREKKKIFSSSRFPYKSFLLYLTHSCECD